MATIPGTPPVNDALALPSELAAREHAAVTEPGQVCTATQVSVAADAELTVLPRTRTAPATGTTHQAQTGQGGEEGEPGVFASPAITATKYPTPGLLTQPVISKSGSRHARDIAVVQRVDAKLRRKAQAVVMGIARASELNDDGTLATAAVPEGWTGTAEEYRAARDARKNNKEAPVYISLMARVNESYIKANADQAPAPALNADIKIYVAGGNTTYNYPVVDVTEREKG